MNYTAIDKGIQENQKLKPINLLGRESSIKELEIVFKEVAKSDNKIIMVRGESGVGKSILVYQTILSLLTDQHYFCSGKFDQYFLEESYSAIKKALENLIKQLLTESKELLNESKKELLKMFGDKGSVLINFLPELEKIIGKQRYKDSFDFQKNQRILYVEVVKFLTFVCSRRQSVTLFIDDLQWADSKSLELLEYIVENIADMNLLLIGAYRSDEIFEEHELLLTLNHMSEEIGRITTIELYNLDIKTTEQLILDKLKCNPKDAALLADIVKGKTLGNPFYISQLLQIIINEGFVAKELDKNTYFVDFEGIKELDLFEDVIQVILSEIQKLNGESIEVLKVASCIGSTFKLDILSYYFDEKDDLEKVIELLVKKGLIYKNYGETFEYQFTHDKVTQAMESLVNKIEERKIKYELGRIYLEQFNKEYIATHILKIMQYFIVGLEEKINLTEDVRLNLAEYFLLASNAAIGSIAFTVGKRFCEIGLSIIEKNPFIHHYNLAYRLNYNLAYCSSVIKETSIAEKTFDLLLKQSKSDLEKAEIYHLKAVLYSCNGYHKEGIEYGLKATEYLGIPFHRHNLKLGIIKETIKSKILFSDRHVDRLLDLPEMESEKLLKVIEIVMQICPAASMLNDPIFSYLVIKGANISAKYGNSKYAIISYSGYAVALTTVFNNVVKSERLEDITFELDRRYQDKNMSCGAIFALAAFVTHYKKHVKVCIDYFDRVICDGMEVGDYNYVGVSLNFIVMYKYISGAPLVEIIENINKYETMNLEANKIIYQRSHNIHKKMCENLMSTHANPELFDKKTREENETQYRSNRMTYDYLLFQKDYLFGNYLAALTRIEQGIQYLNTVKGYLVSFEYHFYYALTLAATYDQINKKNRKKHLKKMKACIMKMRQLSDHCEENYYHKLCLMEAEYYNIQGEHKKAIELYDKAIASAKENEYIQNEAIANECAAKFYYKLRKKEQGLIYLVKASECYEKWGALAKIQVLKESFSDLYRYFIQLENQKTLDSPARYIHDEKSTLDFLDDIINESDFDSLLEKVLNEMVILTNSKTVHIIIENNNELIIEATNQKAALKKDIEAYEKIPKTIVRYISRTNEVVDFRPDKMDPLFVSDVYLVKNPDKAILCLPLLFKGIFLGLIYLEGSETKKNHVEEDLSYIESLLNVISSSIKLHMIVIEEDKKTDCIDHGLTDRELKVLELMGEGMSNKEISETLNISISTTKTHLLNIFGKLEVNNRIKAVIKAQKLGIFN